MEGTVQEVSTQEGYALWARAYDEEKNALIAVEEPYVERLLSRLVFENALDVGTGTGRLARKLAQHGARVTALDQSPEMLAVAQQSASRERLEIDFRLGSLEDGVFRGQQFDLLTCGLMLCHVPDLLYAARQFAGALQAGGSALITDFHPAAIGYGWRTSFVRDGEKYVLPTMPHTKEGYREALRANGFNIVEMRDLRVGEVPDGYLPEGFAQKHREKWFGLIILAQKV
jgi:2-polyprenyl-3-methyl-5-hydroxy-6-metoxy-1,4-benzoquinol methylase